MNTHEIILTLPEELYALLASRARTSAQAPTRQFALTPDNSVVGYRHHQRNPAHVASARSASS